MNIGLFIDTYYPQINGVITSSNILKQELIKLGHNVIIVTVKNPDVQGNEEGVIRIPSIPSPLIPDQRLGLIYSQKVMNKIRSLNLDIIHTQTEFSIGIFGRIVAKRLNIPVIHTYHTMYEDYMHYITDTKMKKYAQKIVKKASYYYCMKCDSIIAPSQKTKEALISYGLDKNIEVIPTGINIERFRRGKYSELELDELKQNLGIKTDSPVILFIGRVAKEKSIDVIIKKMPEILKKIPGTVFLIVGDGPARKALQHLSIQLGIEDSIIFAGERPWEDIGKYYQIGDVFVSASTTETQGITFVEAMSAEVPIVAKYDKNLDDMLKNNVNGLIFYNNEELLEKIMQLLNNKDYTNRLLKKAVKDAEKISAENFAQNVLALYRKFVYKDSKKLLYG